MKIVIFPFLFIDNSRFLFLSLSQGIKLTQYPIVPRNPIYLLADSQLLFSKNHDDEYYLTSIHQYTRKVELKAVYIGWSNGNQPEFYEIFKTGMANIGINKCHMLSDGFNADDKSLLLEADVILLAGGDVIKGYNKLVSTGAIELIRGKYESGTILIGISAGAIQLGKAWQEGKEIHGMMQLVPYNIDAHDEANEWSRLKQLNSDTQTGGLGTPFGGGIIYHNGKIYKLANSMPSLYLNES